MMSKLQYKLRFVSITATATISISISVIFQHFRGKTIWIGGEQRFFLVLARGPFDQLETHIDIRGRGKIRTLPITPKSRTIT